MDNFRQSSYLDEKKIRFLNLKSIPMLKKPNLCKKIEMGQKKSSPRRLQVQESEIERERESPSHPDVNGLSLGVV
jgi:hypothetical protein